MAIKNIPDAGAVQKGAGKWEISRKPATRQQRNTETKREQLADQQVARDEGKLTKQRAGEQRNVAQQAAAKPTNAANERSSYRAAGETRTAEPTTPTRATAETKAPAAQMKTSIADAGKKLPDVSEFIVPEKSPSIELAEKIHTGTTTPKTTPGEDAAPKHAQQTTQQVPQQQSAPATRSAQPQTTATQTTNAQPKTSGDKTQPQVRTQRGMSSSAQATTNEQPVQSAENLQNMQQGLHNVQAGMASATTAATEQSDLAEGEEPREAHSKRDSKKSERKSSASSAHAAQGVEHDGEQSLDAAVDAGIGGDAHDAEAVELYGGEPVDMNERLHHKGLNAHVAFSRVVQSVYDMQRFQEVARVGAEFLGRVSIREKIGVADRELYNQVLRNQRDNNLLNVYGRMG